MEVALSDEFSGFNGTFFKDGKPHQEPEEVVNATNQEKIWDLCVKYTGL